MTTLFKLFFSAIFGIIFALIASSSFDRAYEKGTKFADVSTGQVAVSLFNQEVERYRSQYQRYVESVQAAQMHASQYSHGNPGYRASAVIEPPDPPKWRTIEDQGLQQEARELLQRHVRLAESSKVWLTTKKWTFMAGSFLAGAMMYTLCCFIAFVSAKPLEYMTASIAGRFGMMVIWPAVASLFLCIPAVWPINIAADFVMEGPGR